jgi:hypothetical protein
MGEAPNRKGAMSHYTSVHASGENIALAHTVYGDAVEATKRPNSTNDNVKLAVGSIFSNYGESPQPVTSKMCATEGCRAYSTKTGHCAGHSRSLGLIEKWGDKREPE